MIQACEKKLEGKEPTSHKKSRFRNNAVLITRRTTCAECKQQTRLSAECQSSPLQTTTRSSTVKRVANRGRPYWDSIQTKRITYDLYRQRRSQEISRDAQECGFCLLRCHVTQRPQCFLLLFNHDYFRIHMYYYWQLLANADGLHITVSVR